MRFEEFLPDNTEDYYLWRNEKGESRTTTQKKEQSWTELEKEAKDLDMKLLPPTMKKFPAFLPFFLSMFPFRANPLLLGFVDKVSTK